MRHLVKMGRVSESPVSPSGAGAANTVEKNGEKNSPVLSDPESFPWRRRLGLLVLQEGLQLVRAR
ncbi:MAG: hypothetical protein ACXWC2_22205, partial [Ramlibacter sp.]